MKQSITDYIQAEELRQFIEKEVLKIIEKLLDDDTSTKEKLQGIARKTLELIRPGMPIDELYQNTVKLDDDYSDLAPVVIIVMREYETKYARKALTEVSNLIKTKKFDQAQELVKKVLEYKIGVN
ncbi:MAG: hypothetical protein WCT22_00240 [Patescibacteria group bacterium]|jgi:hypothetical protein